MFVAGSGASVSAAQWVWSRLGSQWAPISWSSCSDRVVLGSLSEGATHRARVHATLAARADSYSSYAKRRSVTGARSDCALHKMFDRQNHSPAGWNVPFEEMYRYKA